jgi:RecA-family ATPase
MTSKPWDPDEFMRAVEEDVARIRGPRANNNGRQRPEPLSFLDVAAWDGQDVPPREWAVKDRIARRNVALLSGEGGVGKSILIKQLAVAHVIARDWLGSMPEPGPVIYVNAEDDECELHYRIAAVVAHYATSFAALKELRLVALAGKDAILSAPDRTGIIRPTPLFEQLREAAATIKPILIALDTAADMFAGNENDRSHVRQFIGLLRGLAIVANGAVLLASHPSLIGMSSDSGLSGSTGWHNSVRTRLYFKPVSVSEGEQPNPDLRELVIKKNNYGPSGEQLRLRWQNGVFVPISPPSTLEKMAADQAAEELFLHLFDRVIAQGQTLNHHPASPTYAPRRLAEQREANGTASIVFAGAMQRLLETGRIRIETYGRPSRPYSKLVRT